MRPVLKFTKKVEIFNCIDTSGKAQKDMAKEFNISDSTISSLKRKRNLIIN